MTLHRTTMTIAAMARLFVSCSDEDAAPASTSSTATNAPASGCARTTAPADHTNTYTFTHNAVTQGVDSHRDSAFSHLTGLEVAAPAANTEPLSFTISVLDGATIATIRDVAPGTTCGIDHDFAAGDYFILSSDGNGTQFSSSAP